MFEHSIPVPRLYRAVSKITENVSKKEDSVKNLVYQTKHPNKKALYALAVETLKRSKQLDFLLKRTKLLKKEPMFNEWLSKVLITELLWGKKRLAGESKPVKTILGYEQVLKAHASDIHENNLTIDKVARPRFVRVNTILATVQEAIEGFTNDGWTLVHHLGTKNYADFLQKVANLSESEFMIDIHIPELLIFPPNTEFFAHNAYKNGLIVLQDKASCLPAHLLNPTDGSTSLDMCAAPGMKTSHLAAKINNRGKVFAVDVDSKRLKTLEGVMETTGVTCVEIINKDVLQITDSDCPNVEYILVDPSCSGSGIVDRVDLAESTTKDDGRIQKLKGFQIKILKHALRKFPKAKRIVYSTCSMYPEENEEVVQEILSHTWYYKLVDASKLLKASWINYGSEKYGEIGKYCLYSRPDQDLTNGFFVAVFERLEDGEENKYSVQSRDLKNAKSSNIGKLNNNKKETEEGECNTNTSTTKKRKNKKSEQQATVNDVISENKLDLRETNKRRKSKDFHIEMLENDEIKDIEKTKKKRDVIESSVSNDYEEQNKKKKKSKTKEVDNLTDLKRDDIDQQMPKMEDANNIPIKKKKKKRKREEEINVEEYNTGGNEAKRCKKKHDPVNIDSTEENTSMKKKKKKRHTLAEEPLQDELVKEEHSFVNHLKNKKKKKSKMVLEANETAKSNTENISPAQEYLYTNPYCETNDGHKKKKLKHKHNTDEYC